jgi:hypothetical protein
MNFEIAWRTGTSKMSQHLDWNKEQLELRETKAEKMETKPDVSPFEKKEE